MAGAPEARCSRSRVDDVGGYFVGHWYFSLENGAASSYRHVAHCNKQNKELMIVDLPVLAPKATP